MPIPYETKVSRGLSFFYHYYFCNIYTHRKQQESVINTFVKPIVVDSYVKIKVWNSIYVMVNEQTVAVQWKSMKYANAIKILSISLPEKS